MKLTIFQRDDHCVFVSDGITTYDTDLATGAFTHGRVVEYLRWRATGKVPPTSWPPLACDVSVVDDRDRSASDRYFAEALRVRGIETGQPETASNCQAAGPSSPVAETA